MKEKSPLNTLVSIVLGALLLIVSSNSIALDLHDKEALGDLTSAKALFDITTPDGETLLFYLQLIGESVDDMKKAGVEPEVVILFHGKAVEWVTNDLEKMPNHEMAEKIHAEINKLTGRSEVNMEACSVANKVFGVKNESIVKGVHVANNTWISSIGYQNRGYAIVPVP